MNDNKTITEDEMTRAELLSALVEARELIKNDDGGSVYAVNYIKWEKLYLNKFFTSHKASS